MRSYSHYIRNTLDRFEFQSNRKTKKKLTFDAINGGERNLVRRLAIICDKELIKRMYESHFGKLENNY